MVSGGDVDVGEVFCEAAVGAGEVWVAFDGAAMLGEFEMPCSLSQVCAVEQARVME